MAYFQVGHESGKRHKWLVKVLPATLLKCCEERMSHHQERIEFWTNEQAKVEELFKLKGVKVNRFDLPGGHRSEARQTFWRKADPSLANRMEECESKIQVHQTELNRFAAYVAFLKIAGDGEALELNADDVLYFNLEGADIGGEGDE